MNRSVSFTFLLLGFLFSLSIYSASAWWSEPVTVFQSENGYNPESPLIASLSRSGLASGSTMFKHAGLDVWFFARMENSVGDVEFNLKLFYFLQTFPSKQGWYESDLSDSTSPISKYSKGFSMTSFYRKTVMFDEAPAAYLTFIEPNPEFDVFQIVLLAISWDQPTDSLKIRQYWKCDIEEPPSVIDCGSTFVLNQDSQVVVVWDEKYVVDQVTKYRVCERRFDVLTRETEDGAQVYDRLEDRGQTRVIEDGIIASEFPNPKAFDVSRLNKNGPVVIAGQTLVYWQQNNMAQVPNIYMKALNNATCQSTSVPLPGAGQRFNPVAVPYEDDTSWIEGLNQVMLIYEKPGSGSDRDLVGRIVKASWNPSGYMEITFPAPGTEFDLLEGVPAEWNGMSDNSSYRLQGIAYDSVSHRVVACDRANHRVFWIDDPMPESPGCWISETEGFLSDQDPDNRDHSQLSRIAITGNGTEYHDINRLNWIAQETTDDRIRFTAVDPKYGNALRQEIMFPETGDISDIRMASDDFSTIHLVYKVMTATGPKILWNSNGLLTSGTGEERVPDRFDFPFDVDVVPPVWTPTPSESPPPPTVTPAPPSYWVADMRGNRIVRVNYNDEIIAQSRVATPVGTPTWSPLENCAVIAPNAVSAAYDGSCWAVDWGRNSVVKVMPNGDVTPISTPGYGATDIIHPCALDCGGDPNSCFVADFEGNKIVKLSASGSAVASQVKYYRPISVKVMKTVYDGQPADMVWVADRWNIEGTPNPQGTWTPYPTSTPSPQPTSTVPAGSPTFTPIPDFSPTPYPMIQRVSQNRFGFAGREEKPSSIPLMISPKGDVNNSDCWIADRNGGFFRKNVIRRFKIRNGQPAEIITYPAVGTPVQIVLPVDVEAVGNPVD